MVRTSLEASWSPLSSSGIAMDLSPLDQAPETIKDKLSSAEDTFNPNVENWILFLNYYDLFIACLSNFLICSRLYLLIPWHTSLLRRKTNGGENTWKASWSREKKESLMTTTKISSYFYVQINYVCNFFLYNLLSNLLSNIRHLTIKWEKISWQ